MLNLGLTVTQQRKRGFPKKKKVFQRHSKNDSLTSHVTTRWRSGRCGFQSGFSVDCWKRFRFRLTMQFKQDSDKQGFIHTCTHSNTGNNIQLFGRSRKEESLFSRNSSLYFFFICVNTQHSIMLASGNHFVQHLCLAPDTTGMTLWKYPIVLLIFHRP